MPLLPLILLVLSVTMAFNAQRTVPPPPQGRLEVVRSGTS
jgi:hypothetical protein